MTGEPGEGEEWKGHEAHGHEGHEGYGGEHDWRRRAEALGVGHRIRYQPLNAEHLPFPSESFDGVFLYDALQHIQNRRKALAECIRVTRPNGIICVIETNESGIEYYREEEGFEIECTGCAEDDYTVVYQAHVDGLGDIGPFRDGEFCGTRGESRRVEAIRVRVAPKS